MNLKVRVAKLDASNIARAIEMSETRGFVKALIDEHDHIVGVTTFCVEGGELLAPLQLALQAKLPYQMLRDAVLSHPTLAESLNNLFMQLD
jgi:pyruvate/2-oxoglutarate dehydrogenase complex dihydrolipoamide dehydrogenase (E3) component